MSDFKFKPETVDFGFEPCTKHVKFVHKGALLSVISYPSWIGSASIEYSDYDSDADNYAKGLLTLSVSSDSTRDQESGVVIVRCDDEDFLIPVVYNYDSEHIRLMDVIDNVILASGADSYIGPNDKPKAILAAKRWIQDNGGITGTNARFAELSVDGNQVSLPGDFVDYIGLYIVSSDGYLSPLYVNKNINIGQGEIQDEDSFYLLDNGGFVIGAYGLTPRVSNSSPFTYYGQNVDDLYSQRFGQKTYMIKGGEISANGVFRYDNVNRTIFINSPGIESVVLEYVSDPMLRDRLNMDTGALRVHKNYMAALEDHIYYKLIERNRFVPMNEKIRALKAYKLSMKRAKLRKLNMNELIQCLKGEL